MSGQLVLEIVVFLITFFYRLFEGIVLAVVPWDWQHKKTVNNDIVLITGAGSGIGRLMAKRFASLGATLVLLDVNESGNRETADQVQRIGASAHAYTCDLSDRQAIYATAEKIKSDVGAVSILVNNAGIVTGKPFISSPDELIEKTMQVNTNAHFWTAKAFLPSMIDNNKGHIVTIASSAGLVGVNGLADYCASKFAAVGFDEALRAEIDAMGITGVHTTVVCPFFINTGMFDGVTTRFPSIMPIMNPDVAVDSIMAAILTNQHTLIIPRNLYTMVALKGLLPVKCGLLMMRFFGTSSSMDDFKGRQNQRA